MKFRVDGELIHVHISKDGTAIKNSGTWHLLELLNNEGADNVMRLREMGIALPLPIQRAVSYCAFVIPGRTRFKCVRCGSCCRNIRGGCPKGWFLEPNNCIEYENRLVGCRQFPFMLFNGPPFSNLLMIATYCKGYGQGDYMSTEEYKRIVSQLSAPIKVPAAEPVVAFDVYYDNHQTRWFFKR